MDDDASSYHRFLNGDESGFVDIVKAYNQNLLYFINGIVGNITVAEDLMEDTFVDLIVYKNRFKGNSSFKTFLFAIARNKAVDYIRKHKKLTYIADINQQASELAELENSIIQTEEQRAVAKALDNIRSEYKAVLILLYFEDMSYEDASKVLKKTNKQVKNLAYLARKSIKTVLEKEGFNYEES